MAKKSLPVSNSEIKICSVIDCDLKAVALGLCMKHYQRLRAHGTTALVQQRHWGAANGRNTPEYSAWVALRNRCENPRNKDYPKYGGRGIKVCSRWLDGENGSHPFECFLADMGPRPSKRHSIDRKDVSGNYTPENCRWTVSEIQCRNRRSNRLLTAFGQTRTLVEWANDLGTEGPTIAARLRSGWTVEDAVSKPVLRPSK